MLFVSHILLFAGFVLLTWMAYRSSANKYRSLKDCLQANKGLKKINQLHTASLLVMAPGTFTYLLTDHTTLEYLQFNFAEEYSGLSCLLALAVLVISIIAGQGVKKSIPSITKKQNDVTYLGIRTVFLVVYEMFFRVALLSAFMLWLTPVFAILCNTILYMLAHYFSERRELIGSLPFGVILCLLTILHDSVWPAVILHLLLSIPYEIILLSSNHSSKTTNHESISHRDHRLYR